MDRLENTTKQEMIVAGGEGRGGGADTRVSECHQMDKNNYDRASNDCTRCLDIIHKGSIKLKVYI